MNIKDKCTGADKTKVCTTAFAAADSLQDYAPADQVLGSAVLFLLWCRRYGVDPKEMMTISAQLLTQGIRENNQHVGALTHFMRVDILDPKSFTF